MRRSLTASAHIDNCGTLLRVHKPRVLHRILHAARSYKEIADHAVQIHGGAGLEKGNRVERLYREVRALTIYEGTSEIQRQTIARQLLRE